MPQYQYANKNVLKLGAALTAGATTLTLQTGTGSSWPAISPTNNTAIQATLMDAATGTITEIVTVTQHVTNTDTLTIVRAQEGTTAQAFAVGDYVVVMMTKTVWDNFKQFIVPEKEATATFAASTGNGWFKIATMTLPQSTSTAKIEIYGGQGYNANTLSQACMAEIVLRAANSSPVGMNIVAYINAPMDLVTSSSSLPLNDIAVVNTSGTTWDVYIFFSTFSAQFLLTAQCTSNASISALGNLSGLTTLPGTAIKGKVYANVVSDVTMPQGVTRWILHNSTEAAQWATLAGSMTATANGELMFGIGDNTLKIRGIIRGTMGPSAQLLNITAKRPYGCTIANATYFHVWPSTGLVAGTGSYYTERVNTTTTGVVQLNGSFPSGASWIMVNIDIQYY